jgi:hypothetical protein
MFILMMDDCIAWTGVFALGGHFLLWGLIVVAGMAGFCVA